MRMDSLRIFVVLTVAFTAVQIEEGRAAGPRPKRAFVFRDVDYFHRWSKDDQHEFTPEGQEDLDKWSDMMTVNVYPDVAEGEGLAATANAVLENYKNHQAKVLKTRSVPRTAERPAEHLIAVIFTRPDFVEIAFARLKLVDGKGCSLVFSHRIYGEDLEDESNEWLSANAQEIERLLMEWSSMPTPAVLSREQL